MADGVTKLPHERVTSTSYFRDVLKNMGGPKMGRTVQFGTMGDGVHPNYQIATPEGEVVTYNGANHKVSSMFAEYDTENLSSPLRYEAVQELLKNASR